MAIRFKGTGLRAWLFQLARRYANAHFEALCSQWHRAEREARDRRQLEIERITLEAYVGQPVIMIGNEWTDPVIGFALRVDFITQHQDPILVIQDDLSGREVISFGKLYRFSLQRFDALYKLTPYERCSLIYNHTEFGLGKPQRETVLTKKQAKARLEAAGFFTRLEGLIEAQGKQDETQTLKKITQYAGPGYFFNKEN